MARPLDPNAPYRISIHTNNGYRYASTQPASKDPVTGKTTHKRIHWGTVDENNKFILDEMRPIRCIEHPNTKPVITPFVGKQVTICEAFGFTIPEGCAPEYVVRKTNKGKRGRPRKNSLVVKEEN